MEDKSKQSPKKKYEMKWVEKYVKHKEKKEKKKVRMRWKNKEKKNFKMSI